MAKRKLNPRSLARRLDVTLPPGGDDWPAADEDPLVDMALRLSASPPPEPIGSEAKARIRSQVLHAYRQQAAPRTQASSRRVFVTRWTRAAAATLAVIVVGLILVRVVSDSRHGSPNVTAEPLLNGTPESIPAVESPLPTAIVIEGVVEAIQADSITVFGMDIGVDPTDSTFSNLRVGDRVRVEGELVDSENTVVFVAVSITVVDRQFGAIDQSNSQPLKLQPGPPIVVPPGCEIAGLDDGKPRLECPEE